MNQRTRNKIEREAEELRQKHGMTGFPLDVAQLAAIMGVRVSRENLEDKISGALFAQEENVVMAVNANHAARRQRFTMAHELGHYVLHWSGEETTAFVDGSLGFRRDERSHDGSVEIEIEANAFAAELLMPRVQVEKMASAPDFDWQDETSLRKLSGFFGVSEQAVTVRLTSLGLLSV